MAAQPFFPNHPLSMPAHVSITCPVCSHQASFEAPYWIFYPGDESPTASGAVVEWSGKLVQERFPGQVAWNDLHNSAFRSVTRSKTIGVAVCSACGLVRRHLLDWPNDAFFKCDIRGKTLWAWNRSQLVSILEILEGKHRNQERPELRCSKISKHFLISKHRDLTIESIKKLLASICT